MDKLFAKTSESLAKAGMDRRGFLGRLASATGGAVILAVALAQGASADHCDGSHFCITNTSSYCGSCGEHCQSSKRPYITEVEGENCYTGETCPTRIYYGGCGCTIPNNPCPGE